MTIKAATTELLQISDFCNTPVFNTSSQNDTTIIIRLIRFFFTKDELNNKKNSKINKAMRMRFIRL